MWRNLKTNSSAGNDKLETPKTLTVLLFVMLSLLFAVYRDEINERVSLRLSSF